MRVATSRGATLALLLASLSGCATLPVVGGEEERTAAEPASQAPVHAPMRELPTSPKEFLRRARGTYVVVDLDVNRLRLMQDTVTLWEAPVGTGTGLRLKGDDGEWHFTTPRGVFQIQYKEELPVWVLPDWYYVEKKLPIPPPNAPERRQKNQLGIAAVYLGEEIAIHGTERPELLGKRVSHGCIRLANLNALRLFHDVQVGTPVVIIGGEDIPDEEPPATTDPGRPKPKATDPLAGVPTPTILERLGTALENGDSSAVWVPLASRMITRGLQHDDATALRGILALAGRASDERLALEYGHFLADAFSRGALRTVVSLARIDEEARARAAEAIVRATMSLYPLDPMAQGAPWPSARVPRSRLGPDGQKGWEALADAEAAYRLTLESGAGRPGATAQKGSR